MQILPPKGNRMEYPNSEKDANPFLFVFVFNIFINNNNNYLSRRGQNLKFTVVVACVSWCYYANIRK